MERVSMRIAIGSDHRGHRLQLRLVDLLCQLGHEVEPVEMGNGKPVDYPEVASVVARKVSRGLTDRGILISGRGIGMCIAANKFRGVRSAVCHEDVTAEVSRRHHDLNVLCLASEMLDQRLVERMVKVWLDTSFEAGRHARRVEIISTLEREVEMER